MRVAALGGGRFPGQNPTDLQKQLRLERRKRKIKHGSEVNFWQCRGNLRGFRAQTLADAEESRTNTIKASPSAVSVILSAASTSCLRLRDNDTEAERTGPGRSVHGARCHIARRSRDGWFLFAFSPKRATAIRVWLSVSVCRCVYVCVLVL